ncbi:MAG TPA: hypothetical protein VNA69_21325 [Thermoanaerobaculia bacterium]|nr:hypothetical protein [Thermoanaerobaculia bacterium]
MRVRLLPLFLLALACASGGGDDSAPAGVRPSIEMSVRGSVHMDRTGEGPMTLVVRLTNQAADPITIRRVRVQSWAMEQWAIDPAERYVVETLAPGEAKIVELSATAYRKSAVRFISEPLTLRALVDYEAGGRRLREVVIQNSVGQ